MAFPALSSTDRVIHAKEYRNTNFCQKSQNLCILALEMSMTITILPGNVLILENCNLPIQEGGNNVLITALLILRKLEENQS